MERNGKEEEKKRKVETERNGEWKRRSKREVERKKGSEVKKEGEKRIKDWEQSGESFQKKMLLDFFEKISMEREKEGKRKDEEGSRNWKA